MQIKLIASLAAAIAISGCAAKAPPAPQAVDLQNEGIAKTCTPSAVDLAAAAPATIAMTNDGWCGVVTAEKDSEPFKFGLVKARPAHGRVYIRPVNGQTRVEYSANAGFVGSDSFTVALVSRTDSTPDASLRVDVAVTQGEGQAVAPPPAPTKKPAARTPARRRTTRR